MEATMIIIDNSEWMRSGDFVPNRYEAQVDAVKMLFQSKRNRHPENTVGLLSMAGKRPTMLTSLCQDQGKILNCLHNTKICGKPNFVNALQIAQLALKHRQNKSQQQHIIAFIASPLDQEMDSCDKLTSIGKQLKKNGVSVDVVNFGESQINTDILSTFISTVLQDDNSHLVTVDPTSGGLLSDAIVSSPIVGGEMGGDEFEFEADPELALALKMSLEEETARQQQLNSSHKQHGSSEEDCDSEQHGHGDVDDNDEDKELALAIAMSMESPASASPTSNEMKRKLESEEEDALMRED